MAARIELAGRIVAVGETGRVDEDALAGRRGRLALAYLVLNRGRAVPREELAQLLWPDELPPSWDAALRNVLSKARSFLTDAGFPRHCLSATSGCWRLRLPDGVCVDVEDAIRRVADAERCLETGNFDAALRSATRARDVLACPLLPGIDAPWVDGQRVRLQGLLLRALEVVASGGTALGDVRESVAAAEEGLDLDPFRESLYRALMTAHSAAGNRAEALQVYERCRTVLAEELGVDPSPATEHLYLHLLREPKQAYRLLADAKAAGGLAVEDLELLAEAALWTGHHEESVEARQRAYQAYLEAGDELAAARVAMGLVANHAMRLHFALAEGWFHKAARLLEDRSESPEHGFLAFLAAVVHLDSGDVEGCLENARRAFEIGRRFGVADVEALGLAFQGCALVRLDRVQEGMPLLAEAMASAVSGGLAPLTTGLVFCRTIWACVELFEFARAAEWIDEVERCAAKRVARPYPGDCHAHRAAVLAARGSWAECEQEAEQACRECQRFDLSHVGMASYTLGEVHLRRGHLEAAEAAFQRANEYGRVPQPGLALLALERSGPETALASITAALEHRPLTRLERARLLPAKVEIALAAGQLPYAHAAAIELAEIAAVYQASALRAAALRAEGAVLLARAAVSDAVSCLSTACELYREAEAPYDAARSRLLLAEALRQTGDAAGASLELRTARALFQRLGAREATARWWESAGRAAQGDVVRADRYAGQG